MHVAVIGAGALGSAIASGLAKGGRDITLVARGARLQWLRQHPVELECDGSMTSAQVCMAGWDDLIRPVDIALLCIKASDVREVARQLAPCLAPKAAVVTLQNGVEAPLQVAELLPGTSIVAGRVHGFFEMSGQRVRHVGVPPSVVIGGMGDAAELLVSTLSLLLRQAGFACEVSSDIVRDLWEKLMLAASLGPVAAVLGVHAGQVCQTASGEALLHETLDEVARVASACGATLGPDDVDRTLSFIRQFPANATTSLQRDLMAKQPSEYDALVGAVLRSAQLHRVPVPVITELDSRLRARAAALP